MSNYAEGLQLEITLPGSEGWSQARSDEELEWAREYELTSQEYEAMYAQYDERSVLFGVRAANERIGMSRLLLPYPNSTAITDAGFLTIHAAQAEDDAHGTPVWGKLDISDTGMQTLTKYDARVTLDALTHIVKPTHRGRDPRVHLALQSLQFGFAADLFRIRASELPPAQRSNGPAIITCMVRKFLEPMERDFSVNPGDKNPIIGVQRLGEERDYGAREEAERVTAVILPINEITEADRIKRPKRPYVSLQLSTETCPDLRNSSFIRKYLGDSTS